MIEMYPAGASTRRIEGAPEALWGAGASAATVSSLNEKALAPVEEWRSRPLARAYPYAYVDGTYLGRPWGGACGNVAVKEVTGVSGDDYLEMDLDRRPKNAPDSVFSAMSTLMNLSNSIDLGA